MGTIDDIRKAFQDIIAPELRAISVRLESVEKRMDERLASLDKRIDAIDKRMDERLESFEKIVSERFSALDKAIDLKIDIDRRLQKVESRAYAVNGSHREPTEQTVL